MENWFGKRVTCNLHDCMVAWLHGCMGAWVHAVMQSCSHAVNKTVRYKQTNTHFFYICKKFYIFVGL